MLSFAMSIAASVLYILLVTISVAILYGIASPQPLLSSVRRALSTRFGFISAAIVRLVFGALVYVVAAESRYPLSLQVIAVILVCSAFFIIFIGQQRLLILMSWVESRGVNLMRCLLLLGLIFIGFLLFALS